LDLIIVYGTDYCIDCIRVRSFLLKKRIAYKWIDISKNVEAEIIVRNINNGNRSVPTIIFTDGTIMVEPSISKLSEKINKINLG
jgi:mycoredoxin